MLPCDLPHLNMESGNALTDLLRQHVPPSMLHSALEAISDSADEGYTVFREILTGALKGRVPFKAED